MGCLFSCCFSSSDTPENEDDVHQIVAEESDIQSARQWKSSTISSTNTVSESLNDGLFFAMGSYEALRKQLQTIVKEYLNYKLQKEDVGSVLESLHSRFQNYKKYLLQEIQYHRQYIKESAATEEGTEISSFSKDKIRQSQTQAASNSYSNKDLLKEQAQNKMSREGTDDKIAIIDKQNQTLRGEGDNKNEIVAQQSKSSGQIEKKGSMGEKNDLNTEDKNEKKQNISGSKSQGSDSLSLILLRNQMKESNFTNSMSGRKLSKIEQQETKSVMKELIEEKIDLTKLQIVIIEMSSGEWIIRDKQSSQLTIRIQYGDHQDGIVLLTSDNQARIQLPLDVKQFSISLEKDKSLQSQDEKNKSIPVNNSSTSFQFALDELKDQKVHKKRLFFKIKDDVPLSAVVSIRVQLLLDLKVLCNFWKEETEARIKQVEQIKNYLQQHSVKQRTNSQQIEMQNTLNELNSLSAAGDSSYYDNKFYAK